MYIIRDEDDDEVALRYDTDVIDDEIDDELHRVVFTQRMLQHIEVDDDDDDVELYANDENDVNEYLYFVIQLLVIID